MPVSQRKISDWIKLVVPTIGIGLFFLLYFISTLYYPGGSYYDRSAEGFSWMHNYWCNLLGKNAINGELNPARPIAISATASLCLGVGYFYYMFPRFFEMRLLWRKFIQIVGMSSMVFAVFLYSDYHDQVLNVAGTLGIMAFAGTLLALNRNESYWLLWYGVFCIFLIGVNNYIYYTHLYIEYLPLIQKLTLIIVLAWIVYLNIVFVRIANREGYKN